MFGAHYDHVGYQQTPPGQGRGGRGGGGAAAAAPPGGGRLRRAVARHAAAGRRHQQRRGRRRIGDGGDDGDREGVRAGTETEAVAAVRVARGRGGRALGSRYMADYPVVPLDKVSAQLNIDMIGRNRCDDPKEANTVYVVGSDRISTELHNLNEESNSAVSRSR